MDHIRIQLSSILLLLLAGMIFGVLFDCYRIFRGRMIGKKGGRRKGGFLFNFTGDLVFWGLAFMLITPVIYWGTWLELRLYVWLVILAGTVIYLALFSPVIIPWILFVWRILAWMPRKLKLMAWRFKVFSKKVNWWFSK